MTSDLNTPNQAIQNAREALRRGDKRTTRYWAELAASLVPEREEPWLILATVASPPARIAYLEQALKINPNSRRAREDVLCPQLLSSCSKGILPPRLPDVAGSLATSYPKGEHTRSVPTTSCKRSKVF